MDLSALARRCWKVLEAIHTPVYFAPDPVKEYEALGLPPITQYFASRSAPLGRASAELVTATFYSFSPKLIGAAIPKAWEIASPEQVLEARHAGVVKTLTPVLDEHGDAVREAADLVQEVTRGFTCPGRPLYAAHAALAYPQEPVLSLWHGASLVREHRGDGHISMLIAAGQRPVEAAIAGGLATNTLRFNLKTRGFSEEEWQAGFANLAKDGLLDAKEQDFSDAALSEEGEKLRAEIEHRTDRAALEGWDRIGVDGATRLNELVTPMARAIAAAEILPKSLRGAKH